MLQNTQYIVTKMKKMFRNNNVIISFFTYLYFEIVTFVLVLIALQMTLSNGFITQPNINVIYRIPSCNTFVKFLIIQFLNKKRRKLSIIYNDFLLFYLYLYKAILNYLK